MCHSINSLIVVSTTPVPVAINNILYKSKPQLESIKITTLALTVQQLRKYYVVNEIFRKWHSVQMTVRRQLQNYL
jgi:hypothetical protein